MEIKTRFDDVVVNYARWVVRWRWPAMILSALTALFIATGAQNLWFNNDYRAFFSKENPQLNAFEDLQDIYTKNDNILFVIEPQNGSVFTPEVLKAEEELSREAWKLPYALRVDAVTNFQYSRASGDDIIVGDLVPDPLNMSAKALDKTRQIALREPLLNNRLIRHDTKVIGVNVTFQFPGKDIAEVPVAAASARSFAEEIESKYPVKNVYLTGMVMMNNAFVEAGTDDMKTLIPLMYLAMILVMIWLIRSLSGTLATLAVITFSVLVAMGIAGWFKVGLTPPSAQAPTMIMTLAIADSIHILVTMLNEMRLGKGKWEAIVESLRVNMMPVFLTSLTTAIGFLSMNFSEVPPFWHLGNISAVGVAAAFLYSVLFLPAAIAILPVRIKQKKGTSKVSVFDRLADWVILHKGPVFLGSVLIIMFFGLSVTRNELNDQFVNYFDERIPFRTDTDFIMNNLTGMYYINFSIGAGESGGISNPEYLRKLDDFAEWYRRQPGVVHVNSFSEIMKRLNKNMNEDEEAYYRIPDNRELAAQYLLLYEMSLPYGLDLNNQINVDKSVTRLAVTLENITSRELLETTAAGEQWLLKNTPDYMYAQGASPGVIFSHMSYRNIISSIQGIVIALILISIALIVSLRSVKFGMLSLLPNLIPAVVSFGIWGLLVGQVNLGLSIVLGMTLGIVVDDSVHFMSKYLRARRERRLDPDEAVRYAFSSVGKALFVTSVVLVTGFAILSFSSFSMNSGMGQLTAITIIVALVADFLLLPVLLLAVEKKQLVLRKRLIPDTSKSSLVPAYSENR